MAGYSGTPLIRKLGLGPGAVAFVRHEPPSYWDWLSPLPEGVEVRKRLTPGLTFVHLFCTSSAATKKEVRAAKTCLAPHGMIWVSWPKKSSGVASDLDENLIRDFALKNGLVDVKVCAVDDVWSGLKLVIPVKLRKKPR
ncbi:MAG: DUF3052 family protein [Cyclobacteriaceae bacterium]|nr:DUF3052 family protein [Cyclobacteriaceae bacterium]